MKTVVVGSQNPAKVEAVKAAFHKVFPLEKFEFVMCKADSLVSDQPFGSCETKMGAKNRAEDCRQQFNRAEFYVGLEGGLEKVEDEIWAFAWMCVLDQQSTYGFGKTSAFLLPEAVSVYIHEGKELGEAADIVFETLNSKHGGGTVGILTNGLITRKDFYCEALVFALIPFMQPSLYS